MEHPARAGLVVALRASTGERAPLPRPRLLAVAVRGPEATRPRALAEVAMPTSLRRLVLIVGLAAIVAPHPASAQIYLIQWGSYGSGAGQFLSAVGIAVDPSGNVYVADPVAHRVQKFSAAGAYLTQW